MKLSAVEILVAILATLRITTLLVHDDILFRLRDWAGVYKVDSFGKPTKFLGRILYCFWCTSLITAVVVGGCVALGIWWLLVPFALSGGALVLYHWTRLVRDVNY